jgi:hypothetical protein
MKTVAVAALLFLTGCATLVNGTRAELQIRSEPPDAQFEIRDYDGLEVASGTTPALVKVPRSRGPYRAARYDLRVTKDGYLPKRTRIQSRIDGWFWIDWITIVGGFLIDPFTGAMWNIIEPPVQVLAPDTPFVRPPEPTAPAPP